MFEEIRYNSSIQEYESIYVAQDERIARWIAEQYKSICNDETTIFSYKTHVVLNSKSEQLLINLRDRLNIELSGIVLGKEEIDPDYKTPVNFSLNTMRLTRKLR